MSVKNSAASELLSLLTEAINAFLYRSISDWPSSESPTNKYLVLPLEAGEPESWYTRYSFDVLSSPSKPSSGVSSCSIVTVVLFEINHDVKFNEAEELLSDTRILASNNPAWLSEAKLKDKVPRPLAFSPVSSANKPEICWLPTKISKFKFEILVSISETWTLNSISSSNNKVSSE